MSTVILTSESLLKRDVVSRCFPTSTIVCVSTSDAAIPEQPLDSGFECVRLRSQHAREKGFSGLIVSIENEVRVMGERVLDVCCVRIEDSGGRVFLGESEAIPIPFKYFERALEKTSPDYPLRNLGLECTLGSCVAEEFPQIDHRNWMLDVRFGGVPRETQIEDALKNALESYPPLFW